MNVAALGARWRRSLVLAALLLALVGGAGLTAWETLGDDAQRRNDLWRVVHGVCSPHQQALKDPSPCLAVDRTNGFALVPGDTGSGELLLVPTRRISGIEDPALLDPTTPNYWASAWDARHRLHIGKEAVPDDWVGLAVNSEFSRTQDQLHIHVDCVKPKVWRALNAHRPVDRGWHMVEPLPGKRYYVRLLNAAEWRTIPPFRLLAAAVGSDPAVLARQTLVLIGAPSQRDEPAFYLLRQAYQEDGRSAGYGEELINHRCVGVKRNMRSPR
jgi:CDP-diacylglycerol pyrophosphatase